MDDQHRHGTIESPGRTDDRRSTTLPVTGEVGGEGGSFADPTSQVATFHQALEYTGGAAGTSSAAAQVLRADDVTAPSASGGFLRYPTEPPPAMSSEAAALAARGGRWRPGLIGAAAGFAAAAVLHRMAHRRRE